MGNRDDLTFLDELAGSSPTPGGGGASAYCAALGAALSSMVANLSIGKERFRDIEDELKAASSKLAGIRRELVSLIDADAKAFEPLARAYKMPSHTEAEKRDKKAHLQRALVGATEIPLEIMHVCEDVLEPCRFLAEKGSPLAISDAAASAVMCKSAIISASFNVFVNADALDDEEAAQGYRSEAQDVIGRADASVREILEYACKAMNAEQVLNYV